MNSSPASLTPLRPFQVVGLGSELEVTVTLDSVGRYECRAATTGFPEISRQVMVFARGRPEVSARSPQRGAPGATVHVECVVSSVPAPSATVWYLYGRPIRAGEPDAVPFLVQGYCWVLT